MAADAPLLMQISRLLSYTVVVLSVFMKLPQVKAILVSGSTKGINLRTYWMEIGTYLIGFSYGYVHGYHISIYAEVGLLAIQSASIIALVIYYDKIWTLENAVWTLSIAIFFGLSLLEIMPLALLSLFLSLTIPLSVVSKLAQMMTIHQLKSRGNVSILTWSLASYGCLARLFTVYVEVKDMQILLNFFVSFVLNTVVVIQCLYFDNKSNKVK